MKSGEQISQSFKRAGLNDAQVKSVFMDIAKLRADEKRFLEYFAENWDTAFTASECFYVLISRAGETYSNYLSSLSESERNDKPATCTALTQLRNRAAQQYLEIITLVKNGFSDGAFARWRSMYELSVIGSFIHKYGEKVAEKFIEASDSEDRYDWAMECGEFSERKRHVTFGDILKLCDIDTEIWKDNYTVANQTVHASPQGTFSRLGSRDGGLDSHRGDYGISAPAVQSANTLALISSMLFSLFPHKKTTEEMSLAVKWLDELTEIYCEIHDKLFPDDK